MKEATENDGAELEYVKDVLNELFPKFASIDGRQAWVLGRQVTKREDDNKRVANADMFSAYFRYELPDAVYSSVDFAAFIRRYAALPSGTSQKSFFSDELRSMDKGSVRRDDFLKKISDEVETADMCIARALTFSGIVAANEIAYEGFFFSLSEAGHVLRAVLRFALRLRKSERQAFLSECIERAADDTMSFRILTSLTDPKSDANLGVTFAQLYPAFIKRMRGRYGKDVDAATVDLSTSDAPSFNLWGARDLSKNDVQPDPQDREIQHDFWQRYIGSSKARLIRVFNDIFMPSGIYQTDPEPFVENKMSVDLIRRLFTELPDDFDPDEMPRKDINRLLRFLRGDFKNGIGIEEVDDAGVLPEEKPLDEY